jgi:hypothetical protein
MVSLFCFKEVFALCLEIALSINPGHQTLSNNFWNHKILFRSIRRQIDAVEFPFERCAN